jgi:hypothetical protein
MGLTKAIKNVFAYFKKNFPKKYAAHSRNELLPRIFIFLLKFCGVKITESNRLKISH